MVRNTSENNGVTGLMVTKHILKNAKVRFVTCGILNLFFSMSEHSRECCYTLTLLHSERPKLHTVLAFLSAVGLKNVFKLSGAKIELSLSVNKGDSLYRFHGILADSEQAESII